MSSDGENASTEILRKLETAGASGLKKPKLVFGGVKARAERLAALESLLARWEIANLASERSPLFVLRAFFNPLERAYAAVEAKATPGTAKLFNIKELEKGLVKAAVEKVAVAILLLQREKKLIRVQRAKSVFYLHAASLAPWFAAETIGQSPGAESLGEIRRAYDAVVREGGFSDVLIADLHRASAVPLERLKPWLLAQSRAGLLVPSRGDWSLASGEMRAAAIHIAGEPYLRVRFVSVATRP